ncbi:hypothetical protein HHX38_30120 [Streptomyces sp. PKU-MA01144]|uniref:hypothetical protein n=1 Tax=Streptomyces sp. PKU-MA01144 TaxID=2729138 RepID=UPI00147F3057|nr:hypothetical protein [Streptomyces sp. PKU-MA01144]NNJ08345.1 hypothetical protein [Streptomyces sp. PKU-MA01144]
MDAGTRVAPEAPEGVTADAPATADTPVTADMPVAAEAPATVKAPKAVETHATTEMPATVEALVPSPEGMSPRRARMLRIAAASVVLVALAAVLAVRLASRTSVLVVGVYGLAMILCGVVIELSRHGRTRLGTYLLGAGLVAALAADWLLLP